MKVSRSRFWMIAGLLATDSIIYSFTNPRDVPSFMLVVGFLLLAVTLYYLLVGLIRAVSWYGLSLGNRSKRLARLTAFSLSGLIALQSIGQLSTLDILVLLPLSILVYLYISYGQPRKNANA